MFIFTFRKLSRAFNCCIIIYAFVFISILFCISAVVPADVGERCEIKQGVYGVCAVPSKCPDLGQEIQNLGLSREDVVRCGFTVYEEIICCPAAQTRPNLFGIFNTTTNYIKTGTAVDGINDARGDFGVEERKATKACRLLDAYSEPYTVPHVLGGSPVTPGEYPHMAAIGYASINTNGPPYEIRCGGTLIDKRFVLTAAHCVNRRDAIPRIVRLGVTDFSSAAQLRNAVDVPIETVHIHKDYSSLQKYDDIALIELKYPIEYSSLVFPACLHTELADPAPSVQLNVTGWGTTNLTTRAKSDVLLTARVKIFPLANCNASYASQGILPSRGILSTQLCTHDPDLTSDACWGDSGGPLNLIVDESSRQMHVIGIVSAGQGCASVAPSLYTRVAAYLDFIEEIVWKNL